MSTATLEPRSRRALRRSCRHRRGADDGLAAVRGAIAAHLVPKVVDVDLKAEYRKLSCAPSARPAASAAPSSRPTAATVRA
jgi:hypothetical protein